jgi:predicted ArsR family transcriptional regulator
MGGVPKEAAAGLELVETLLAAGYHLRMVNALRALFDGRAERAVLPLLLWLCARRADGDAAVVRAASAALACMGLDANPRQASYSLRAFERAVGIPRETLRRHQQKLEAQGWLTRGETGGPTVTGRVMGWLRGEATGERMRDFRWTAARLDELLAPAPAGGGPSIIDALAAMRACRTDELPASLGLQMPEPPGGPPARAAEVWLHAYNLRHLLGLAVQFDGALIRAVVLGEIGHRNMESIAPTAADGAAGLIESYDGTQLERARERGRRGACNAYSLAQCLGVSFESMRRTLAWLCARDWVERDAQGLYWVRPQVGLVFRDFNIERRGDMYATSRQIEALPEQRSHVARSSHGSVSRLLRFG